MEKCFLVIDFSVNRRFVFLADEPGVVPGAITTCHPEPSFPYFRLRPLLFKINLCYL